MKNFGHFTGGTPVLLDDNRATLSSDLSYTAPDGTTYYVQQGFSFDGASIPRRAWSIIGHPFIDGFVRAAALHDFHCTHKTVDSVTAHKLFYYGLRADGVGYWRAKTMWAAVRVLGPRFSSEGA